MEKVKPNISLTERLGFKSLAEKTTANVGEQMSYTHTRYLHSPRPLPTPTCVLPTYPSGPGIDLTSIMTA